jgi:predicted Zn-dependent protease
VILSVISAELGRNAAGGLLNQAGVVTLLSFNRDQERAADEAALSAVAAEYGHLAGAFELFEVFQQAGAKFEAAGAVEFLRTHPLTASRRAAIEHWAAANKVPTTGSPRPLPPAIAALRGETRHNAKAS